MLKQLGLAAMAGALVFPAAAASTVERDLAQIRGQIRALQDRRTDDERRIQELERRLQASEDAARAATSRAQAAETAARAAETKAQNLASGPRTATAKAAAPTGAINANSFNPGIGIVLDGKFAKTNKDPDTYSLSGFALSPEVDVFKRGFFLGEAEINAFANVDDLFFASLTAALETDGDRTEIELEEAYVQTTSLPWGFTARAGKFFSDIGYLNSFHAHADDFADRPLAYRAYVNDQFKDVGAQLTWVAPTRFLLKFGGELYRGDNFPAQGAANGGVGAKAAFVRTGGDISTEWSWQAGLSYLRTNANELETNFASSIFSGTNDLGIAHAVLKWAPNGNPTERNLKLQTEVFRNRMKGQFNGINVNQKSSGLYSQAVYQFMPNWKLGYRFDWLRPDGVGEELLSTSLDKAGHNPYRHSTMVEFNNSEFSRIRLQYNYDRSRNAGADNQVILQYTVSFGAHHPHQY